MCYVVVLSQKQRRRLCDRVSRLISMSLSIKLQHSWLCLYQKLPGMPTIFVIYLAQHSSVCGFATHRFDIFVSRFLNYGILFNVSAYIIHVHLEKFVACAPTHTLLQEAGLKWCLKPPFRYQISIVVYHAIGLAHLLCFKGWAASREQFRNPLSTWQV